MSDLKGIVRLLPVKLTESERIIIADLIAAKEIEVEEINTLRTKVKSLREEITDLSYKYKRGEEDREVNCTVTFNVPRAGMKTIIRIDTGEVAMVEPMTDIERTENAQLNLLDDAQRLIDKDPEKTEE